MWEGGGGRVKKSYRGTSLIMDLCIVRPNKELNWKIHILHIALLVSRDLRDSPLKNTAERAPASNDILHLLTTHWLNITWRFVIGLLYGLDIIVKTRKGYFSSV